MKMGLCSSTIKNSVDVHVNNVNIGGHVSSV